MNNLDNWIHFLKKFMNLFLADVSLDIICYLFSSLKTYLNFFKLSSLEFNLISGVGSGCVQDKQIS